MRRKLTDAEYQEIASRLLAKWEKETQSQVTQARAGRRQSASSIGQRVRADGSQSRPQTSGKDQQGRRTTVRKADRPFPGLGGGGRKSPDPAALAARRGGAGAGSRNKDVSPAARQSTGQAPPRKSLVRYNSKASFLWSVKNGRRVADVHAKEHVLAWWRCPRRMHPDWQEYIDVVASGRGQCPACRKAPPVRPRTTARGAAGRTRRLPTRSPEKTPYEKAFGTDPELRKLNPPEAIRDAWR